jgi:TRAP-type transport system periplasmic protein
MSRTALRVGGYAPADSVHSRALDHFAQFVHERSDGAVAVDVLHNVMDQGRPIGDLLHMVQSGELTWCYLSTSYLGSTVPLADALEIPFLFDSLAEAHEALDGRLGAALTTAIARDRGLDVLGYWDNGFRHLTNAVRPVTAPDDCAGLTIRLQPNRVHEELARSWGMVPVPAELSEGIRLIASSAVDAQENPLANTVAYGVEHAHITLTAHLYGARALLAHPHGLGALDDDVAALVRAGARAAIEFQRVEAERYEHELRADLEQRGRQIIELSAQEREAFAVAAASVIAAARDGLPDDVHAIVG